MSDVPEGYRMSEVGVIPEEWEVKTLGDCLLRNPEYGINAPAVPYSDNLPTYIRITDISEEGRFLPEKKSSVSNINSNNYFLEKDDIVFARTGASTGKTYLYNSNDGDLVFAGFLIRVKVNPNELIAQYLKSYTEAGAYWNWVKIMSMRSGQPGINGNEYAQLRIPLPQLPEQQAIASALSDVDALITALEQLITKKCSIKQGAMQQLLTGKKRLPGFGGEWKVEKIKNISSITTGARNTQDKIDDAEYPFFVRSSIVERINSYSFDGEAVLTAGDGVGTGKVFHYINGKFDFHQRVYKISDFNEKIDGYFFYLFFSNYFLKRIMAMTAKSSVDSVRMEMIAEMPIPLPPLPEQQTIAQILSDMDTEIEALKQKQDKYKAIKQGMMQELLTGKTRLA